MGNQMARKIAPSPPKANHLKSIGDRLKKESPIHPQKGFCRAIAVGKIVRSMVQIHYY